MGKFDHFSKLEIQAELRRVETIPQKFWGDGIYTLRDRLAEIEEEERRSEGLDMDRRHKEQLEHSQAQLREQVRLHEQAMEQERNQHRESLGESRRQFAASLRYAQIAAVIASVAALAAIGSAWYARVQSLASSHPPKSNISTTTMPTQTPPPKHSPPTSTNGADSATPPTPQPLPPAPAQP